MGRVLLRLFLLATGAAYVLSVYYRGVASPLTYWITLAFGLVLVMRLGIGRRLYGKRQDGSIAWWAWCMLGPFFLFRHLMWHFQRWTSRQPPHVQLCERVWVGRRVFLEELPPNIDLVVDLTYEFPESSRVIAGRHYRLFPIIEGSVPRDSAAFLKMIQELLDHSGSMYIHCADGHGRTCLVAAALLMARGDSEHTDTAVQVFRQQRGAGFLTLRQRSFLAKNEPTILALRGHHADSSSGDLPPRHRKALS